MTPTLNQFRYFRVLAETGHFGRAASQLNMSQPPLSRQIAALEHDLGTTLFERTPRGVTLTPAGEQFLRDARDVLRLAAQAERNATAAGRGALGELRLGFTMCAAHSVVPDLARRYTAAFPGVTFRVREMMPTVLEQSLLDGTIDLGISFPGVTATGTEARSLFHEPLDLVVPESHRLARSRRPRVAELSDDPFLIVPRDQAPILHDRIIRRCEADGFTPRIGLEVYLQQTIITFVAEGLGVAFVPASMGRARVAGAVFRAVSDPPMIEQMLYSMAANRNPCIAGFMTVAGLG